MEPSTSLSVKETIADLVDSDKPLLSSKLADLSSLGSGELRFLEQVWSDIEPERRRQIVYRLVKLAEDNFELNYDSIFWNCLQDQDVEVRCRAIEGLWENEETSLINPLINLLEQDSSEEVQAVAATALGRFVMLAEHGKLRSCHASKVSQALLAAIGNESKTIEVKRRALEAAAPLSDDAEIRYEAAGACGELGEKESVPYLIGLIDDPDTDVQLAAIQALGEIGGTEAKESLEQYLNHSSEIISQVVEQTLRELEAEEELF